MNADILFDSKGDLPTPSGYLVIESEVDFLRNSLVDIPLLIRGERLCAWAEDFYRLRGRSYRYQESLRGALQRTFPKLTQQQAQGLAQKMGIAGASLEQVSPRFVLEPCYPNDFFLWQGSPSREHAARWLLWLCTHHPDDAEVTILRHFAHLMEQQAGASPVAQIYRAVDGQQARVLLDAWLGLNAREYVSLGEFPVEIPAALLNEVKSRWMTRLIETNGTYFNKMLGIPLPVALRQELAQLSVQFYEDNPQHLTNDIIRQLQPYLTSRRLTLLEEQLPPPEPIPLPDEELAVLDWFQAQYLPYRRWQARNSDEKESWAKASHLGRVFACWYLMRYPNWLLNPGWLSFQQTTRLSKEAHDTVSFCVILDGLPAWDAEDFARVVSARIERLQLQQKSYCFAPLPTVTEFAKNALFKGVPPRLAAEYPPLGTILPDSASPVRELDNIQPGSLIFWRIGQPDAAYHFEAATKRERKVRAELEVIIQAVQEVTEALPPHIPLQVIVTTDHGRLLNPKSPRRLPIPLGMQAHGRVAWGSIDQQFDESGFSIDDDAGWIAVHGERYGMLYDMLIALGEDSFQNAKSGFDPYPHGGLFPEEAIVPWFIFERDAKQPDVSIMVTGKGEAQGTGTMTVSVTNLGRVSLECLSIWLSHGAQANEAWSIPPLKETRIEASVSPWPVRADLEILKVNLLFRQPSGRTFTVEVTPSFEVRTLYERDDAILKDLGL